MFFLGMLFDPPRAGMNATKTEFFMCDEILSELGFSKVVPYEVIPQIVVSTFHHQTPEKEIGAMFGRA